MISISHWGLFPLDTVYLSERWYEQQRNRSSWEICFGSFRVHLPGSGWGKPKDKR